MIYTIEKLREHARDVDNRLENMDTYPDTWIDMRIEEGLALAQELQQVFFTNETYDLATNMTPVSEGGDGLTEVEILLQEEVHSIYGIELDVNYFTYEVTPNNHIIVSKMENVPDVEDKTVKIQYFFYPTLPITTIEMSMEVYRLCKHTLAAVCFGKLSDEANEQYHISKANKLVETGTFDIVKDRMDIPTDRLWRGSWA